MNGGLGMYDIVLYLLFKQIINSIDNEYTTRFRDIRVNKHNEVGVFIKGGEVDATTRLLKDATYTEHYARVQLIIQGSDSEAGLFKALNLKNRLRDTIERAFNDKYIVQIPVRKEGDVLVYDNKSEVQNVEVNVIKADLLGEPDFKGYTSQGISRDIVNFKIQYSIMLGGQ